MLGMIGSVPMCGAAVNNPWKAWVDHIMKQKKKFGFKKAALVKFDGLHIATSSGILVTEAELMKLARAFCDPNTNNNNCDVRGALSHSDVSSNRSSLTDDICETLTLCGKTYIIKTKDSQQIVAFNGSKCYIITKTRTMYIVVLTESRSKREAASHWLRTIASNFRSKKF